MDTPEDRNEYEIYRQANAMARVLSEFRNQIRTWNKYDERELIPKDEIHEKFFELVREENLSDECV
jgi:hypothetical protein